MRLICGRNPIAMAAIPAHTFARFRFAKTDLKATSFARTGDKSLKPAAKVLAQAAVGPASTCLASIKQNFEVASSDVKRDSQDLSQC
jgi:hypothetical protein